MIALIPARGGSKGLPKKNIKFLCGKPLIAYTIESAIAASKISKVIVSTDSEEIAQIAKKYGAEVPFLRPDYLATDDSLAVDSYIYTIDKLESILEKPIESIVVLLPTTPLRGSDDIDNAIKSFEDKLADSVISYTEVLPVEFYKYIDNDGRLASVLESNLRNRQDCQKSYRPNGAIYIFSSKLLRQRKYFSQNSFAYIMDQNISIDIDTLEDFEYAEYLINKKNNG